MARKAEAGKYIRLKEYPHVPSNVLRTGATIVGALALAHFLPEAVHNTGLHNIWGLEGLTKASDWSATHVSDGIASLTGHIPTVGHYAESSANLVTSALSSVHAGNVLHSNDIVTAEAAAAASAVVGTAKLGLTALKRPEVVDAPNAAEQAAGEQIVRQLQKEHPRRYGKLNATEVAVEVSGMSAELRKGQIERSALWAPAIAKAMALGGVDRDWAARTTLAKEMYRRLPGNFIHKLWGVTDSVAAEWVKKIPGVGDTFNLVSDIGDYIVGGVMPKKDVFGKYHFGIGNLVLDATATAIGDFVDFIPGMTSTDFKEAVEVHARPSLRADHMRAEVDQAAAVIVGSQVARSPRRYSQAPRRA